MASLVWLVVAVALVAAEALTGDLFLVMLGGGALAAAGVSLVADTPLWVDGAVFCAASLLLLALVRPTLRRRLGTGEASTPVAALHGRAAVVVEAVGAEGGRVRLDGEVWTARPLDGAARYDVGVEVTVVRIDGATAVVWHV